MVTVLLCVLLTLAIVLGLVLEAVLRGETVSRAAAEGELRKRVEEVKARRA